jgi:hypothetical protein
MERKTITRSGGEKTSSEGVRGEEFIDFEVEKRTEES